MIIKHVREIIGTEREVHGTGWKSRRLILETDGLKYSVHETILEADMALRFTYRAHRETVYCIEGEGSIKDLTTGKNSNFGPGSIYSAGIGEAHQLVTRSRMKVLCIFDPPLKGAEEAE